ncbi:MAG: hypothetical protein R2764_19410 [Bacteroidales bacterium]
MKKTIKIVSAILAIAIPFCIAYFYYESYGANKTLIWTSVLFIANIFYIMFLFDNKERSTTNHLFAFLGMAALYASFFAFSDELEENNKESAEINKKIAYTVGFRSWSSIVEISDIEVKYYDKDGFPYNLKDENVNFYDYSNWKGPLWTLDGQADSLCEFTIDTISKKILLRSCAIALNQKLFSIRNVTDFKVTATFKLISMDNEFYEKHSKSENSDDSKDYYSSQICLIIPANNDSISKNENYLAYEFFYHDFRWSKLRIPEIPKNFTDESLIEKIKHDSLAKENCKRIINSKLVVRDENDSLTFPLRLSATYKNNQCIFYLSNLEESSGVSLFDFKFPGGYGIPSSLINP